MLVEINLIPQKEVRSKAPIYVMLGIMLIAIIASILLITQTQVKKNQLSTIESQIKQTESFRKTAEQQLSSYETNDSYEKLQNAVKWAETVPVDTVNILENLISLLPERGFFQTFSYNEDGSLNLTVQFDTSNEAAYYLSRLTNADWMTDAKILSITTNALDEQKSEEEDNNSVDTEEKILPRYLAVYQLKINNDLLKRESNKKKEDSEGGDGSCPFI